ncbi:MAG: hypothetical protein AAFN74_05195 [Myxococcota bacterium]
MPVQINIANEVYDSTQVIALDGVYFELRLYWNARAGQWVLDLFKRDQTPILIGRPVLIAVPLLSDVRGRSGAPAGEILALDSTGADLDPGQDDWGRVQLVYLSAAEVETALS